MQAILGFNSHNTMQNLLEILLLTTILSFGAVELDLSSKTVAIAILGSVSGSLVLTYFKRDSRFEMIFKILCSSISGLFIGATIQEYSACEKVSYIGFIYFLTSLLSLIFLRAILSFSESNAHDLVKSAIQRLFNLQTPEEKEKRK